MMSSQNKSEFMKTISYLKFKVSRERLSLRKEVLHAQKNLMEKRGKKVRLSRDSRPVRPKLPLKDPIITLIES